MKKIYFLLIAIFFALLANFSVWFMQTQAINSFMSALSKELAVNDVKLNYTELKFSNFKSWNIRGYIDSMTITHGKAQSNKIQISDVKFQTSFIDNKVTIFWNKDILVSEEKMGLKQEHIARIKNPEERKLQVTFRKSLSAVAEALMDLKSPKLNLISAVMHKNSGFELIDASTKVVEYSVDSSTVDISTDRTDERRDLIWKTKFENLKYNPAYTPADSVKASKDLQIKLGNIQFNLDFVFSETVSDALTKLLNSKEGKERGVKKVFDSYSVQLNNADLITDSYAVRINANLNKQPNIIMPNFNLEMDIRNYMNLIDYNIALLNEIILSTLLEQPMLPIAPVSEEQKMKFAKVLDKFNPKDGNLKITAMKSEDGQVMISGKTLNSLLDELRLLDLDSQKKTETK